MAHLKCKHTTKNNKKQQKTKAKKHKTDTDSTKLPIPLALQSPSKSYKAIQYDRIIDLPPSEDPYGDYLKALKEYFKTIHATLGKDILIASWDTEQQVSLLPLNHQPHTLSPKILTILLQNS
jgi:hypothetical protein